MPTVKQTRTERYAGGELRIGEKVLPVLYTEITWVEQTSVVEGSIEPIEADSDLAHLVTMDEAAFLTLVEEARG